VIFDDVKCKITEQHMAEPDEPFTPERVTVMLRWDDAPDLGEPGDDDRQSDADSQSLTALGAGWRQPRKEPLLHFGLILAETGHVMGFRGPPVSLKRLLDESPWLQCTSECQRF
jgi:hypothetical protein